MFRSPRIASTSSGGLEIRRSEAGLLRLAGDVHLQEEARVRAGLVRQARRPDGGAPASRSSGSRRRRRPRPAPCSPGDGRRGAIPPPGARRPSAAPPGRGSRRGRTRPASSAARATSTGQVFVTATIRTDAGSRPARTAAPVSRARRAASRAAISSVVGSGMASIVPRRARERPGDAGLIGPWKERRQSFLRRRNEGMSRSVSPYDGRSRLLGRTGSGCRSAGRTSVGSKELERANGDRLAELVVQALTLGALTLDLGEDLAAAIVKALLDALRRVRGRLAASRSAPSSWSRSRWR